VIASGGEWGAYRIDSDTLVCKGRDAVLNCSSYVVLYVKQVTFCVSRSLVPHLITGKLYLTFWELRLFTSIYYGEICCLCATCGKCYCKISIKLCLSTVFLL